MRLGPRTRALSGIVLLMAMIALLLGACDASGASGGPAPESQQVFNYQLVTGSKDIATMDPAIVQDAQSILPIQLIFPALVTLDANLHVVPWAATSVPAPTNGGVTYTFKIRPGLKFSDGEPIDASAFAYAMNRSLSPCLASPVSYYLFALKDAQTFANEVCNKDGSLSAGKGQTAPVIPSLIGDSLIVTDAQTLTMTLAAPAPYFLSALTYPTAFAVPRKLIQQYGETDWVGHLASMGFGGNLFELTLWDHTGDITLKRNDSFWGQKPILRKINIAIFKDRASAYNSYQNDQFDFTRPPAAQYTAAKTQSDFHESPTLSLDYFQPNWNIAPFDDLRVRQAFDLALDRSALASDALHGAVIPSYHIVPEGMPGYNVSLKNADGTTSLTGNPAKATQLINAYAAEKCGGKLSGCPPVVLTAPSGDPARASVAQAALQMWRQTFPGYPLTVQYVADNTVLAQAATQRAQLLYLDASADYPDPQAWLSLHFLPSSAYNTGNVNLPSATDLMQRADAHLDPSSRLQQYNQAEQQLVTNVAEMALDQQQDYYQLRSYVVGFTPSANGVPLSAYQHMYIAQH